MSFRNALLIGCLAAAPFAASRADEVSSGRPSPIFTGEVGAMAGLRTYTTSQNFNTGAGDSLFSWSIYGEVLVPIYGNFAVQIEARHEGYDDDALSGYQTFASTAIGGHVNYREVNLFQVGGFGAFLGSDTDGKDGNGYQGGWMAGAEGQAYLGDITVAAHLGYADLTLDFDGPGGPPDSGFSGIFGGAEGRFFVNDEFMLSSNFGVGLSPDYYEDPGDGGGTIWQIGAGGKIRVLDSLPLYASASYRFDSYEANTEDNAHEHTFLLGVSWLFNAPNLKASDRLGANETLPLLPARAAGWGEALD